MGDGDRKEKEAFTSILAYAYIKSNHTIAPTGYGLSGLNAGLFSLPNAMR